MKTVHNFNGTRCPSCKRMVRDASPTGAQGAQGFQDATPRCQSCGYPLTLRIPAEVDAVALAERMTTQGLTQHLQLAFDNSVRQLEHDMVNPPARRRERASFSWRSLAVGAALGAAVAVVLAHFFGGHL